MSISFYSASKVCGKFAKCIFILFSVLALNISCESSDDDEYEGGGLAPSELKIGKYVNWWGTYFRNGKEYSETLKSNPLYIQILNKTDHQPSWSVDWGTYTYEKTGENTATLSFSAVQSVPGNVRSFQYNATLTFTSKNCFDMTGTKSVFSSMTGSSYCQLNCHGIISSKHSSDGYKDPYE